MNFTQDHSVLFHLPCDEQRGWTLPRRLSASPFSCGQNPHPHPHPHPHRLRHLHHHHHHHCDEGVSQNIQGPLKSNQNVFLKIDFTFLIVMLLDGLLIVMIFFGHESRLSWKWWRSPHDCNDLVQIQHKPRRSLTYILPCILGAVCINIPRW